MTPAPRLKVVGVTAVFAAVVLAGMFLSSKHVKAIDDDSDSNESRIERGFDVAPVPLNLEGRTGPWWDWAAIL